MLVTSLTFFLRIWRCQLDNISLFQIWRTVGKMHNIDKRQILWKSDVSIHAHTDNVP